MDETKLLRVYWVMPAQDGMELVCIDAPPQEWHDKIRGRRIHQEHWDKFIIVQEVIDEENEELESALERHALLKKINKDITE